MSPAIYHEAGRPFVLMALFIRLASAATVTLNSDSVSGGASGAGTGVAGDLRSAIVNSSGGDTILFNCGVPCTIVLNGPLPPITHNLTIDGGVSGNVIIDGQSLYRVFFADTGIISLRNLRVQNGWAQGGAGAIGGGGGGLGAGGGLFVNQAGASVTVANVFFVNCRSAGGAGGSGSSGAGGGGLVFAGGSGEAGAGGGGVLGAGAVGPAGNGGNGGGGGGGGDQPTSGVGVGGAAFTTNAAGAAGGLYTISLSGSGGSGGFGGGGGGGGMGGQYSTGGFGGAGGFGGGGGAGGNCGMSACHGGNGGPGGPGGGGGSSGNGGIFSTPPGGAGGGLTDMVHGGAGATGNARGGGGGAGAGPAIFVNLGRLTTVDSAASGSSATGGAGAESGTAGTADSTPVFNYLGSVNGYATSGPVAGALSSPGPVNTVMPAPALGVWECGLLAAGLVSLALRRLVTGGRAV